VKQDKLVGLGRKTC